MVKEMTELELTKLIKQLSIDEIHEELKFETAINNERYESETSIDGWVQVKDHSIIVKDPIGNGKPPVIRCSPPVRFIVNDNLVESQCTVSSTDRIRWEIDEKPLFEISVTEDKMQAFFHLHSKERYAWQLMNAEPAHELHIRVEQNKHFVLETVQLIDVVGKIERLSITSNLDIAAVQRELDHPTHQPVLIARGKEAIPGKDAKLYKYVPEHVESQFFEVSGILYLEM